ncbi:hypothetical protein KZ850_25650, partial [Pseudomonas aeruginosa]|nr:hypothetical protein [Pseudomonas aeruginosa]
MPTGVVLTNPWASPRAPARSLPASARGAPKCWLRSVSYTHLRAHETLAKLVCRLLLEKKKKAQMCYKDVEPQ